MTTMETFCCFCGKKTNKVNAEKIFLRSGKWRVSKSRHGGDSGRWACPNCFKSK